MSGGSPGMVVSGRNLTRRFGRTVALDDVRFEVGAGELHALLGPTDYEPPRLIEIGGVYELTLNGCFMDKKWGGTDGLNFGPITIPVSSC